MPRIAESADERSEEDTQSLPDSAEAVIWAQEGEGFRCHNPEDYADELPESLDFEDDDTVVFEPGESLPLELAEDIYDAVQHFMVVYDESGEPIFEGEHADAQAMQRYALN